MLKPAFVLALLAAGSASAGPGLTELESGLDAVSLFDRDSAIAVTGEAGSGFGEPFAGAGLDVRLTSSKFFLDANTHLGLPFSPLGFYLSLEGALGAWFDLGPIIFAPLAGVLFDGPPHESAQYAFEFGSAFEMRLTRRLAVDLTVRVCPQTNLGGILSAFLELRVPYRVNRNYDLTVGARVAGGYHRGLNQPNTITTVFAGITM